MADHSHMEMDKSDHSHDHASSGCGNKDCCGGQELDVGNAHEHGHSGNGGLPVMIQYCSG